jgi:hypothetical protein
MQKARQRAYDAGRVNVERIAVESGGATYWSTKKNYSDAISAIANQIAGQYIVTFVPRDIPGVVRPMKVTSTDAVHVLSQSAFITALSN